MRELFLRLAISNGNYKRQKSSRLSEPSGCNTSSVTATLSRTATALLWSRTVIPVLRYRPILNQELDSLHSPNQNASSTPEAANDSAPHQPTATLSPESKSPALTPPTTNQPDSPTPASAPSHSTSPPSTESPTRDTATSTSTPAPTSTPHHPTHPTSTSPTA